MSPKVKFISRLGFTLFLHFISHFSFSQKYLQFLGGIEFTGLPYDYKFQQQGSTLQRAWAFKDGTTDGGLGLSLSLAIQYRLSKKIALETGMQFSEMDLIVNDNRFMNKIGIKGTQPQDNISGTEVDHGNFDAVNWYRSNYISGYYFLPSRSQTNLYLSGGVSINYLTGPTNMTGSYYYRPPKEDLILTSHYEPFYVSSFIEAGLCFNGDRLQSKNKPIYFLGLKYYFAGDVLSGDYKNVQNGNTLYTDHVDTSGSHLSLTFKMGGALVKNFESNTRHKDGYHPSHYSPTHSHSKYKPSNHTKHHPARRSSPFRRKRKNKLIPIPKKDEPNTRGW